MIVCLYTKACLYTGDVRYIRELPLNLGGSGLGGSDLMGSDLAGRSSTKFSGNTPRTPFRVPSHHPSSIYEMDK